MILQNMFKADINRDINGVIYVGQDDDYIIEQELSEYVVTKELRKHFDTFFTNYEKSIESPTNKIGVWISGFYGSGKSHFLKILSLLLANKEVKDKKPIEYFRDKFDDPMRIAQMEQCVKIPTDTILFNIDSKGPLKKDKTVILQIFAKVFYEHRGFYGKDLKIARFEQFIDKKGKTDEFKSAFKKYNGGVWEESRDAFAFYEDDVVSALQEVLGMSEESARNWFNGEESAELSIEKLVSEIKEYIDSKGKNYRLLFMIDEIGQYIGSDSDLMLNLQTIVEEIGSRCEGRVWVIVTSQEKIDEITKIKGNDFSKIQGRFNTRLSLSSSSIDEVIKKRILAKTDIAKSILLQNYDKYCTVLRNLFDFDEAPGDIKGYAGENDFVDTYPFVSYQFRLVQNVLAQIRKHGNSGQHFSGGERSMISAFQESAQAIKDKDENALIPFSLFYNTVHTFLESSIRRVIDRCQDAVTNGDGMEQYDVEILKLLYLIRYVDEIKSNLSNIVVLMVDNIEADKIANKQKIQASLDRLVKNNYVSKNGEIYTFLTDDEQDITKEINATSVDSASIDRKIKEIIFGNIYKAKKIRYNGIYDFAFNKLLNTSDLQERRERISLRFITSSYEYYSHEDAIFMMESNKNNEAIIVLSDEYKYFEELEMSMKIRGYVRGKNVNVLPDVIKDIIRKRQQQASEYEKRAEEYITKSIAEGRIYVVGEKLNIKTANIKDRIETSLTALVESVYTKLNYIRKCYNDDDDIIKILSVENTQMLLTGADKPNSEAIFEVEQFLQTQSMQHFPTSMNDIHKKFSGIPFGWREVDIAAIVAGLIAEKKIVIRYAGNMVLASDKKLADYLRKKSEIEKAMIENKPVIDSGVLKRVREFLRDYFDMSDIPMDSDDVVEFVIAKFEEEKNSLSDLLSREYATHNYPDKGIVEDGIELCKDLLSQKKDSVLLLKKVDSMSDDLLDFAEDYSNVRLFFKNQRETFDNAVSKISDMEQEKDYLQNEANAMKILNDMKEIIRMQNPYRHISKLPDLSIQIDDIYNALLDSKREEVNSEITAAMAEIHQTADKLKQADIIKQADDALTFKRETVAKTTKLTALDAMKVQIGTIRQQYMRRIVEMNNTPDVKAVQMNRSTIGQVATIKNNDDIEKYLDQIRKKLQEKLSDNDVIQII